MWRDRLMKRVYKEFLIFRYDPVENLYYRGLTTEVVDNILETLTANDLFLVRHTISESNRGLPFLHRSDPDISVFVIIMDPDILPRLRNWDGYRPGHVYFIP